MQQGQMQSAALGRQSLQLQSRLALPGWGSPVRKALGVLSTGQSASGSNECQWHPGLYEQEHGQEMQGSGHLP